MKPDDEIYGSMRKAIHYLCEKGLIVYLDNLSYDYIVHERKIEFSNYFSNFSTINPFNMPSNNNDMLNPTANSTGATDLNNNNNNNNNNNQYEPSPCADKIKKIDDKSLNLIDFIVSFGGDGLLMHCNTLFEASRQSIPPIMSFDFGSMGFLAPFYFEEFEQEVCI